MTWSSATLDPGSDSKVLWQEVERLRAVLGHCPRCIAVVATDGRIVGYNRAFARLFHAMPPIGGAASSLFDEADRRILTDVVSRTASDESASGLFRVRTISGRLVDFFVATLPGDDESTVGVVLAGDDATAAVEEDRERATVERHVVRTNERTAFNLAQAMLAHDIANALSVATVAFDALRGQILSAEDEREIGREGAAALQHARELLDGI